MHCVMQWPITPSVVTRGDEKVRRRQVGTQQYTSSNLIPSLSQRTHPYLTHHLFLPFGQLLLPILPPNIKHFLYREEAGP